MLNVTRKHNESGSFSLRLLVWSIFAFLIDVSQWKPGRPPLTHTAEPKWCIHSLNSPVLYQATDSRSGDISPNGHKRERKYRLSSVKQGITGSKRFLYSWAGFSLAATSTESKIGQTEAATRSERQSACVQWLWGMDSRDSGTTSGIRSRFLLKGEGQGDGRAELSPICCWHHLISVKLNVRMTDAANWRQVRKVKLRSTLTFSTAAYCQDY